MAAFDQQHPTSIQDFHSPEGGRKAMMTMLKKAAYVARVAAPTASVSGPIKDPE
jgi:hypothetical protein